MKNFLGLCAATMIGFLAANPVVAEEITASVWFPDTHPLTRDGYLALAKELEARSNGELTMQVYTGTALLPPVAHLSGLKDGLVQMTYHAGTYTPSDLPEDNVGAVLAIGLDDPMVTMMAVADFYMNDPAMKAMFDRHDIVFLGAYASPVYEMMCNKEITTLEQIRGAKMRMPSPIHTAWATSVGAASVNVPSSEMYSGLEKGQLDCAVNALNDLKSRSLWDVAKHATRLSFGPYFAGWEYAIDRDTWTGLSEDHRRLMLDAIADNTVDLMIAYQATVDEAVAEAASQGVTISEPSAELQASLDTFVNENATRIATETGAQLGAQDTDGIISRFGETYAKWEKLLTDVPREDAEALQKIFRAELYDKVDAASYGQN
ncbi:MAG TPA: C4-dicarboxylate TRAP transporter substrate-binding protein [Pseudorhizobium sp.]|jgi:TRAP-type C4-dicarboxylate transport system substrate-binding protein|nr:C4-dicarboxylate TRAP transporter substrate-binding protein [Pseudorhizobium sp.]